MLYERIVLMHELLSGYGTLYVHIGPTVSHYVKVLCDEVFGESNFLGELVWKRSDPIPVLGTFPAGFSSQLESRGRPEPDHLHYSEAAAHFRRHGCGTFQASHNAAPTRRGRAGSAPPVPPDVLGPVIRVVVLTAAMTGLRQSDLLGLRWRDVDWTEQRIRVRNPWVRGEHSGDGKSDLSTRRSVDAFRWETRRRLRALACVLGPPSVR